MVVNQRLRLSMERGKREYRKQATQDSDQHCILPGVCLRGEATARRGWSDIFRQPRDRGAVFGFVLHAVDSAQYWRATWRFARRIAALWRRPYQRIKSPPPVRFRLPGIMLLPTGPPARETYLEARMLARQMREGFLAGPLRWLFASRQSQELPGQLHRQNNVRLRPAARGKTRVGFNLQANEFSIQRPREFARGMSQASRQSGQ